MNASKISAALMALSISAVALADKPETASSNTAGNNGKQPPPATYTLQSSTLRLDVTQTYSFKLTELSSNNLLLTQNLSTFTIGSSSFSASKISNITQTATTLDGDLVLSSSATAHVNFTFVTPDNLQVSLTGKNTSPSAIAERFTDVSGERYYGVWENALPNALDNRGISAGYDGKEVLGTSTKDVYASSARAPFCLTNKNYALYANTEAQGTYAFGVSGNTTMKFNAPSLQYNILHGTSAKDILSAHNTVAGAAFMPPDWAFSTIFWRDDNHQLPPGVPNAQALVLDDATRLANAHIHAGAIWLDRPYGTGAANQDQNVAGWGNMDFDSSFPDPSQMTSTLNSYGVNLLLWVANKANNQLLTDGAKLGYVFTGNSASPAIDLRNPNAYDWYKSRIGALDDQVILDGGHISGYKIDRGGEGEMPDAVINVETTLLQKLLYENMQARNGSDFFNFSRNINGKGRQYAAVWSGDPKTTWLGLQTSVKNGIRSGLINFPMWGSDTGGYSGSAPSEELFTRWIAFSAFSSMMEIIQGPGRNIFYDFSPTALANTIKYTNLHHDLIPYTRSLLATALQTGTPVMRAMFLEFSDAASADAADEYMFGPNILVAPVYTAGAVSRSVYLPVLPGGAKWIDYNNPGTRYASGQTISASAPVGVIPLFIREGSIIPRGDVVAANTSWNINWMPALRIEIYPAALASSFVYYGGNTSTAITSSPLSNGYQIAAAPLSIAGAFNIYLPAAPASVVLNGTTLTAGTDYTYDTTSHFLVVAYATNQSNTLDVHTSP